MQATSDTPVARNEILTRYRHLRALSRQHNADALTFSPRQTVLDYARRLGLAVGKTLVADNIDQVALAFDLAIYSSKEQRSRAIDRYRRAVHPPPGSDDGKMLDAMCNGRFSVWRVERWHEVAGLIVSDVLRGGEVWLVDEGLEATAVDGVAFAARLCRPDVFSMTGGIVVPVNRAVVEDVFAGTLTWRRDSLDKAADHPRFALALYRVALARGMMDAI